MFFETHDVFSTHEEAIDQVKKDLKMCKNVMTEKIKIPFLFFKRPQWDKFLGANNTFTPDTLMPDGKRNQLASTHDLGTNFAKAFDIVNLGANSSSRTGWEKTSSSYSRRGLVEDLLNEKYRPFREAYFNYHYNGLDIFSDKKTLAVKNIIKLIDALEILRTKVDINSVLLKTFFDAKSGEIIENLKTYSDKSVFKKLRKIDPSHGLKYDEAAQN